MLAAHADWSVDPRKRWFASAKRDASRWRVEEPERVGPLPGFVDRLRALAQGAPVVLGIDCPIGLPRAYASRLPTERGRDFPDFLRCAADRSEFFAVCETLAEVCLDRPFYPARPRAGMSRSAFSAALGAERFQDVYRLCDRATSNRPAACSLFWTLGPSQVGKAALSAWRDLLLPAMAAADRAPRLWPFEGNMADLTDGAGVVVAEAYPAEALRQFGIRLAGSKRRRDVRTDAAPSILQSLDRLAARATPDLERNIREGFGDDGAGEDRFDACIGLLSVIGVIDGYRPDRVPNDPAIRAWEGWILGQSDDPCFAGATRRPCPEHHRARRLAVHADQITAADRAP